MKKHMRDKVMQDSDPKVYCIPDKDRYIIDRKKVFLTQLAEQEKTDVKDILYQLLHRNVVFRCFEQGELKNMEIECGNFVDLPLGTGVLYCIYSKGSWSGNSFQMPVKTRISEDESVDAYSDVTFEKDITIKFNDLFIYEDSLSYLGHEPDIDEDEISEISSKNLYKLIWVLKDMVIEDGKEKNYNFQMKRRFTSAAQLITQIEEYSLPGLKKRTLEDHFKKANDIMASQITRFTKK